MELNYVFSALSMLGVIKKSYLEDTSLANGVTNAFCQISDLADSFTKPMSTKYDLTTSMLFNAFTEKQYADHMRKHNNYHVKDFYADSGGLQMVTTGHTITEELKDHVYKVQAQNAQYCMCFDEIALESISAVRSKSERSNTQNKVFISSRHIEAGILTGKNIKRQVSHFREVDSKSRVIVIIQGNTYQDMYDFYNAIASQLDDNDYDYIGGMAIADTCMGNKALESIDMTIAAHMISSVAHPNLSNHLHYLGVGSISRLEPVMMLHEKFLPNIKKVSYDSSTHSLTFNNGVWKGSRKNIGKYYTPTIHRNFGEVYDRFEPIASQLMDRNDIQRVLTCQKNNTFTMSNLYQKYLNDDSLTEGEKIMTAVFPYMYIREITLDFVRRLSKIDEILAEKKRHMLALKEYSTVDEVLRWRNENTFSKSSKLPSARIKRQSDVVDLEMFME